MNNDNFLLKPKVEFCDLPCHIQLGIPEKIHRSTMYGFGPDKILWDLKTYILTNAYPFNGKL
jgi:hypothetical protein